jgi:photosystem II stability/assembly factor-like uncharacterized protein
MGFGVLDYVFPIMYGVPHYLFERLFPEKPQEPGRPPQIAACGKVLPIIWGKTRATANIVYVTPGNTAIGELVIVAAICEGEIAGFGKVWVDKNVKASPAALLLSSKNGTRPTQTVVGSHPVGYPGTAILYRTAVTIYQALSLGNLSGATLGQMSFEVKGLRHATGDATTGDADPALVLADAITDGIVGCGVPFSLVTDTGSDGSANSSYARYVKSLSLWLSPMFSDQRPASDHIKEILDATNSSVIWSAGALVVLPLGDTAATGNSVTFTPNLTPQYALSAAAGDFLDLGKGERIEVDLGAVADTFNVCPVEFLNRSPTAAATDPGHAYPDPVDVAARGVRRAPVATLHSICRQDVALKISRIRAQTLVNTRNRYKFKLPWRFARLEPMDLVTLTEPRLGLADALVRIESIEEDETRALSVEAIELPVGTGHAVAHTVSSSDGPTSPIGATSSHELALCNWTTRTVPSGGYRAIAWSPELGLWCAVGGANPVCATSPDGITWTARTIPGGEGYAYYAIAWNGSIFCAVGYSICATSPDGITWTSRSIHAGTYYAIAWNGSFFCAVGAHDKCETSTDGITWTTRTSPNPGASGDILGITWNGNVFCAVGGSASVPLCATSTDGNTWTSRTIPACYYSGAYYAIASGDSVMVAVGDYGWCATSDDDGVTWTQRTIPAGRNFEAIIWTGYVFAAVERSGVPGAMVIMSTNGGITWRQSVANVPYGAYVAMGWSGSSACAIGLSTNCSMSLSVLV